jgi:hypothetical protein
VSGWVGVGCWVLGVWVCGCVGVWVCGCVGVWGILVRMGCMGWFVDRVIG